MDFWRIVVSVILPPLGVFWQVSLTPYPAKTTKPSELTFRVLLSDGTREVRIEHVAAG